MATKVLIVDDAIHIRRLIARMLRQESFVTLEAANGKQALKILRENRPDVVTCDISMPVMDGHQFLTAVKSDPEIANIPIIVVTAMGQEEETNWIEDFGADACLTKPFSSNHLLEIIKSLTEEL